MEWGHLWRNGYRRSKWTRLPEFKENTESKLVVDLEGGGHHPAIRLNN